MLSIDHNTICYPFTIISRVISTETSFRVSYYLIPMSYRLFYVIIFQKFLMSLCCTIPIPVPVSVSMFVLRVISFSPVHYEPQYVLNT